MRPAVCNHPGRVAEPLLTQEPDMRDVTRPPRGGQDPPTRHLTLVHPAPPPKPDTTPRTRSGRKAPYQSDLFSPEEEARLRAAVRHARALFGTWACLADAMRVNLDTLHAAVRGDVRFSGALAIRLARALGKPVESLYGPIADATRCPTCGARRTP